MLLNNGNVCVQMRVSLGRIEDFLNEEEVQVDAVVKYPQATGSAKAVEIVHGVFSWESTCSTPTLKEIMLEVWHGETVAVCGQVGSGKTTLLCAILGEISKSSGIVSDHIPIFFVKIVCDITIAELLPP